MAKTKPMVGLQKLTMQFKDLSRRRKRLGVQYHLHQLEAQGLRHFAKKAGVLAQAHAELYIDSHACTFEWCISDIAEQIKKTKEAILELLDKYSQ